MIVLFILSAITVPSRTLRWPRVSFSVTCVSGLVAVAVSVIWFPRLSCGCAWASPALRVLLPRLLRRARGLGWRGAARQAAATHTGRVPHRPPPARGFSPRAAGRHLAVRRHLWRRPPPALQP